MRSDVALLRFGIHKTPVIISVSKLQYRTVLQIAVTTCSDPPKRDLSTTIWEEAYTRLVIDERPSVVMLILCHTSRTLAPFRTRANMFIPLSALRNGCVPRAERNCV